jgi:hypothetical protein
MGVQRVLIDCLVLDLVRIGNSSNAKSMQKKLGKRPDLWQEINDIRRLNGMETLFIRNLKRLNTS